MAACVTSTSVRPRSRIGERFIHPSANIRELCIRWTALSSRCPIQSSRHLQLGFPAIRCFASTSVAHLWCFIFSVRTRLSVTSSRTRLHHRQIWTPCFVLSISSERRRASVSSSHRRTVESCHSSLMTQRAESLSITMLRLNHRTPTNPTMTQQLQSGIFWRGVVEPKRWATMPNRTYTIHSKL